jgi:hypothetical protein
VRERSTGGEYRGKEIKRSTLERSKEMESNSEFSKMADRFSNFTRMAHDGEQVEQARKKTDLGRSDFKEMTEDVICRD